MDSESRTTVWKIFTLFLRLGLTSFGGPIAHLGYFRAEFVERRGWLRDDEFADLVALCQFLPGPASSQVGMAVGLMRGGHAGALAAWAGFTLPSAALMTLFALGVSRYGGLFPPALLHGFRVVAVAVVAQAVLGMARKLCTDLPRILMAVASCGLTLLWPGAILQVAIIAGAGLLGMALLTPSVQSGEPPRLSGRHRSGLSFLIVFLFLLISLPVVARWSGNAAVAVVDAFYRAGSLVFGGGNTILPLLQAEVVPPGWVGNDAFVAGYGAAQAIPGPLLSFASFLGASMEGNPPGGVVGAGLCLAAIFTPAYLLIVGAYPYWSALRSSRRAGSLFAGVNAAVVGLLLAALYHPVWTNAVFTFKDFALACGCWAALAFGNCPSWLALLLGVAGNLALTWLGFGA